MRYLVLGLLLVGCGSRPAASPPQARRSSDAELEAACRKAADACLDLGFRFSDGDERDVDAARASELFGKACKLGDQRGCALYGLAIMQARVPGTPEDAFALLDTACKRNVVEGCRGVGYLKFEGKGTAKDIAGATAILTKACDGKDGISCAFLSLVLVNEQQDTDKARAVARRGCELDASYACFVQASLTSDEAESQRLYAKACELGDGAACSIAGTAALDGRPRYDYALAVRHFSRGCQLGELPSCRAGGNTLLARPEGLTPDDAAGVRLLMRGCDGNDRQSCAALAMAYQRGRGVARDVAKAIAMLDKTCNESAVIDAGGCYFLGSTYHRGDGVAQSYVTAAKYFSLACDHGLGHACALLAEQYEKGQGVAADAHKAAQLNHRACEADHVASCMKPREP